MNSKISKMNMGEEFTLRDLISNPPASLGVKLLKNQKTLGIIKVGKDNLNSNILRECRNDYSNLGGMFMDKIVSRIVALGVPGLVLLVALSATSYAGAAAITTALAAIGPFGILGGIASLGIIALFSQAITEYGFQAIYVQVIKELIKKGETKESILAKIDSYKISKNLKLELKDSLRENWPKDLDN